MPIPILFKHSFWLGYFNRTLFEQGVINEAECNKLALKIENRKPTITGKR